MDIFGKIKSMWYGENETDIYEPADFDDLFKTEEQEPNTASRFISNVLKRGKSPVDNDCKENNKENIKVIEHPSLTPQSEVTVIEPRAFDEAMDIVDQLRCRRSVVLNLQYLDAEQSQRIVDFMSGATHAIDGHQQRIGQGVFIFAPNNFTINTESQEARALRDAFYGRPKEQEQQYTTTQQYQYAEPAKKSSIF